MIVSELAGEFLDGLVGQHAFADKRKCAVYPAVEVRVMEETMAGKPTANREFPRQVLIVV